MKNLKLIGTLLSVALLFSACAAPATKNDMKETGSDSIVKVDMAKDDTAKDDMAKDDMATEDMKKDDMAKETMSDRPMAEPFALMDLNGETVSLSDFEGKPVYVKFWASWCSICLAGLEELNTFSGEDHPFEVITIVSPDFNGEQSEADFKAWFKGLGYDNIRVLFDANGEIAKKYGVRAYPTSAYIDAEGHLIKVLPGHVDSESIKMTFNES